MKQFILFVFKAQSFITFVIVCFETLKKIIQRRWGSHERAVAGDWIPDTDSTLHTPTPYHQSDHNDHLDPVDFGRCCLSSHYTIILFYHGLKPFRYCGRVIIY